MQMEVGDRIFNRGDVANIEHFGTIVAVKEATRFGGRQVEIQPDEETDREETYWVDERVISDFDSGNHSTRIVTIEAHQVFRARQMEAFKSRMGA